MKFTPEHCANMSRVRIGHPAPNKSKPMPESQRLQMAIRSQKLTLEQVEEIRMLLAEKKMAQKDIAEMFHVSPSLITKVKQGYIYLAEKEI